MPSAPCTHSYTGVTDTTHFTAVHQHTRSRGADAPRSLDARWTLRACRRSPPLTAAARSLRARRSSPLTAAARSLAVHTAARRSLLLLTARSLAARRTPHATAPARSCRRRLPPPSSRRSRRHRHRRVPAAAAASGGCRRHAWGPPPDTNTTARALRARQAHSDERRWPSGDRPWNAMHATHARIFAAPPHATALRQRALRQRAAAAAARRRVR
jgi:hypothetical protein